MLSTPEGKLQKAGEEVIRSMVEKRDAHL